MAAVADSATCARFPMVPPPRPEASRFEGLFWPGSYTIQLPEGSAAETADSYRYRTTVLPITTLLERAAAAEEPGRSTV
jgi:hypothetical protein